MFLKRARLRDESPSSRAAPDETYRIVTPNYTASPVSLLPVTPSFLPTPGPSSPAPSRTEIPTSPPPASQTTPGPFDSPYFSIPPASASEQGFPSPWCADCEIICTKSTEQQLRHRFDLNASAGEAQQRASAKTTDPHSAGRLPATGHMTWKKKVRILLGSLFAWADSLPEGNSKG
ncbi:hypothetical protein JOB18_023540 [Solea senegalensis]|uniref:Uncharacterized protein n=1 Tax=Solea senegalensis TaxID=28829 RepID=A0AAV6REA0_SOLSE|nr:hypothetical protein JOB18_023540 [Solea senegalensis]